MRIHLRRLFFLSLFPGADRVVLGLVAGLFAFCIGAAAAGEQRKAGDRSRGGGSALGGFVLAMILSSVGVSLLTPMMESYGIAPKALATFAAIGVTALGSFVIGFVMG